MNSRRRYLSMSEFPSLLHDEAALEISRFTVGLTRIDLSGGKEIQTKSGSGTLVEIGGVRYILTADHVVEHVAAGDRLGLLVDWAGALVRCAFDAQHLEYVRFPRGVNESAGPDLALIRIPEAGEAMATLGSRKVFFNLDRRIIRFGENFLPARDGVWMPCGVLAEGETSLPAERGFSDILGYQGLCGLAENPEEYVRDEFDYLDLQADLVHSTELPKSFEGLSGGGLWHVLAVKEENGQAKIEEMHLSGVMFYQQSLASRTKILRSHGRLSIFRRIPDLLSGK